MNSLNFDGKGLELFKIRFIKFITSVFTLGLLYPWGKIKELKYLYKKTTFEGTAFSFDGNLREYYRGFIKVWISVIILLALCTGGALLTVYFMKSLFAGIIYSLTILICTFLAFYIQGLAINGTMKYRFNNTSWGTINLCYTGKPKEFGPIFLGNIILTYITLGLYYPWFFVKAIKYILQNLRFGNLTFDYTGDARKLFTIYIKGYILSILTLGIYSIWLTKNIFEYIINNISVKKGEQQVKLITDINTLQVFELLIGNVLIVVFTLGIGYSWAKIRMLNFVTQHCIIPEGLYPEKTETDLENQTSFLDLIV